MTQDKPDKPAWSARSPGRANLTADLRNMVNVFRETGRPTLGAVIGMVADHVDRLDALNAELVEAHSLVVQRIGETCERVAALGSARGAQPGTADDGPAASPAPFALGDVVRMHVGPDEWTVSGCVRDGERWRVLLGADDHWLRPGALHLVRRAAPNHPEIPDSSFDRAALVGEIAEALARVVGASRGEMATEALAMLRVAEPAIRAFALAEPTEEEMDAACGAFSDAGLGGNRGRIRRAVDAILAARRKP